MRRQRVSQWSGLQHSVPAQQQTQGPTGREGTQSKSQADAFCHCWVSWGHVACGQLLKRDAVSTLTTRAQMLLEELLTSGGASEGSSRDEHQRGTRGGVLHQSAATGEVQVKVEVQVVGGFRGDQSQ